MPEHIFRPLWAEIDCSNLIHNFREIEKRLSPGVKIYAVVKADAYGHGAAAVARILAEQGAPAMAVASLEEGILLRESGLAAEILVLGYTLPEWAGEVVAGDFVQTVFHLNLARALSREAARQGRTARVHIKIDTGMGRVGLLSEQALPFIEAVCRLPNLKVEGIFSHMASADSDPEYTEMQFARFQRLLAEAEKLGLNLGVRHVGNSAVALNWPKMRLDAVRPGILLYGLYPDPSMKPSRPEFFPAMSIKTRIIELKTLPSGSRISYGGRYAARGERRIATAPIGYADGFNRHFSEGGQALVKGVRVPVTGSVCMDFLMLDVTSAPNVHIQDEVTLVGRQMGEEISVDELAGALGTINYEVVSLIGKRVPRIYVGASGPA